MTAKANGGTLVIWDNGIMQRITIDRTHYGPEWCRKRNMKITETITTVDGETFNIWKLEGRLTCAIPARME